MDLSFTPDEQAFALEVRAWLSEHAEVPPRFENIADEVEFGRRWQAQLAEGRWVGIHWPRDYGGRGAAPVEVAIFNMEYARSRALQRRSATAGTSPCSTRACRSATGLAESLLHGYLRGAGPSGTSCPRASRWRATKRYAASGTRPRAPA